jgi:hypothetical protein
LNRNRTGLVAGRLSLGVCLVSCLAVLAGCDQVGIIGFLLGGPPTIEPDFDKQTGQGLDYPEITVAVICYAPTDMKLDYPKIDSDVAASVAVRLFQNDIKVINPDIVRAWIDQHPDWEHAEEIGEAMQATHVIEIELSSFDLYEPNSTNLYRGRTEAYVNVFAMDETGQGERVYSRDLIFAYPTEVPRPVDVPLTTFKAEYLSVLSQKIGFLFYERSSGDLIPWSS